MGDVWLILKGTIWALALSLMGSTASATAQTSAGDLIVVDTIAPGVLRQSSYGGQPTPIYVGVPYIRPLGIATDANGDMIVADAGAKTIFRQSPGGGPPSCIFGSSPVCTGTHFGAAGSTYGSPAGVVVDSAGNIIVVDSGVGVIWRQSPSGGTPEPIYYLFDILGVEPSGITIDSAGNFIIATGRAIVRVSASGGAAMIISSSYSFATGVAIDPSGNIMVADSGIAAILRQSPSGGSPQFIYNGIPYTGPHGVAVDQSGSIIVADPEAKAIFRQSPRGGLPATIFSGPPYVKPVSVAIIRTTPIPEYPQGPLIALTLATIVSLVVISRLMTRRRLAG